jgi:predicted RNA-binding protein YlxR (DUF448 family)
MRTCVGCRTVNPKRELIRVVRTAAGSVEPDPTGKKPGRGAYVHNDPDCWALAVQKRRLDHSLKTNLSDADRETLRKFAESLGLSEED